MNPDLQRTLPHAQPTSVFHGNPSYGSKSLDPQTAKGEVKRLVLLIQMESQWHHTINTFVEGLLGDTLGSSLTEDYNPDFAADPKGSGPEHQNKRPQGQVSLGHGLVGEGTLTPGGAEAEVVFGPYHFAEGCVN